MPIRVEAQQDSLVPCSQSISWGSRSWDLRREKQPLGK